MFYYILQGHSAFVSLVPVSQHTFPLQVSWRNLMEERATIVRLALFYVSDGYQ